MSPEESFAGVNPERLAMLQGSENPAPRDFSGRGRGRGRGGRGGGSGGRGGGRGGYQANSRRYVFNEDIVSPSTANGGTKESTPAEEQLSGAEMRLAFKRNQERRSGAVVEKGVNGVNGVGGEEKKRRRDNEDTAAVGSTLPKPSKKRKNDEANGVAAVTNGAPAVDKKQKQKKKEKGDKRAKKAKKHAMEMGNEEATAPPTGETHSPSKQLDDDPNLSKEAKKAAKKAKKERKERKERKKAAKTEEPAESGEDTSKSKQPKPKKVKRSKKDDSAEPSSSYKHSTPVKKPKGSDKEASTGAGGGQAGLKWTAAAADLPGDDQRKSKFLRLLGAGAGASAAAVPTANGSASSSSSTKTREKELEKQYDAGLKMKAEKKRRGLGA